MAMSLGWFPAKFIISVVRIQSIGNISGSNQHGSAIQRLSLLHEPPKVEEMITKAAKKGPMPSQIGIMLHDQHGIPLFKSVTGSKILGILKAHARHPRRGNKQRDQQPQQPPLSHNLSIHASRTDVSN